MKLSIEFDDGQVVASDECSEKTFTGLASQRAFKRQFKVPPVVLSLLQHAFTGDGDDESRMLNPELSDEQVQHLDQEYLAFLVWLELCRRCDDMPDGDWDEIVERVVDVEIDQSEDPTTAATDT